MDAWVLEDQIRSLTAHPDPDVREAAMCFLERKAEAGQTGQ
jgi:hypothetical protein